MHSLLLQPALGSIDGLLVSHVQGVEVQACLVTWHSMESYEKEIKTQALHQKAQDNKATPVLRLDQAQLYTLVHRPEAAQSHLMSGYFDDSSSHFDISILNRLFIAKNSPQLFFRASTASRPAFSVGQQYRSMNERVVERLYIQTAALKNINTQPHRNLPATH